jgi:3-deoxy-D-manno-octulosonic-acid transferase
MRDFKAKFSLWLYSVLMRAAQPLLHLKLKRRAKAEALYGQHIPERFGHYTQGPQSDLIWVHGVSLGESRTAGILLQGLRAEFPGMRLLLTHGTATGRSEGMHLLQEGDVQVWQPWDSPEIVARFLTHFQPRVGLLLETEVWPQWVAQCAERQIPLMLLNARMSEKSMRQALRWPTLLRPAYAGLQGVWAQTDTDAQRLQQLGASVQGVLGNLKFDAQADAGQVAQGQAWRRALKRPVVMLASSREGEEAAWLKAWQVLQAQVQQAPVVGQDAAQGPAHPCVQWLIVPRHPQRVAQVQALLQAQGLKVSRRSAWHQGPAQALQEGDIALGDSMGEMSLYYSMADVALLGGSFEPLGGQNLIEAAACACPVVMGPHTFNFAQVASSAQEAGAAVQVDNLLAAVQVAMDWLQAPQALVERGLQAQAFAQQFGGATQRTAQAVRLRLAQLKA